MQPAANGMTPRFRLSIVRPRPRKLTPHQRQEAWARLEAGETQADVARTYNVDATTIGRLQPSPFEEAATAAA